MILDASIVVRLLANRSEDQKLRDRLAAVQWVYAPELIDAEVTSAVRGLLLGKKIDALRASQMLSDFGTLPIKLHTTRPYIHRVMELRNNFTAYDAFYVALAEALESTLLTADAKFGKAVGHAAKIELYPMT